MIVLVTELMASDVLTERATIDIEVGVTNTNGTSPLQYNQSRRV